MRSEDAWTFPPRDLLILPHDVHVWRAWLDQRDDVVQRLEPLLSADERRRADRFHFAQHREHFIVSRGSLRTILGRYLNIDPGRLTFAYGPFGKPTLRDL